MNNKIISIIEEINLTRPKMLIDITNKIPVISAPAPEAPGWPLNIPVIKVAAVKIKIINKTKEIIENIATTKLNIPLIFANFT